MTSTTQQFGLSAIGQIFVRAKDLDRAVRFYRDTLGMSFLFQAPPQMAFFQCGATTVLLGVPEAPELDHAASLIYYLVPDIASAHATLRARRGASAPATRSGARGHHLCDRSRAGGGSRHRQARRHRPGGPGTRSPAPQRCRAAGLRTAL